jgi:hypothetical protein
MSNQDFRNHTRYDVKYHVLLFALVMLSLIGATRYLYVAVEARLPLYPPVLLFLLAAAALLLMVLVRVYPLQAQDRAIRAEENLRHYVLTGKLLDPRLTVKQIVALRFAPDDEFPGLAAKAAATGMPPVELKKSIVNWKADLNRI